jgi:hypothetical protein
MKTLSTWIMISLAAFNAAAETEARELTAAVAEQFAEHQTDTLEQMSAAIEQHQQQAIDELLAERLAADAIMLTPSTGRPLADETIDCALRQLRAEERAACR